LFADKKKKRNSNKQVGTSNNATEKLKEGTVTIKVKDENAMDIDNKKTTQPPPVCYNCGKKGHITRNCKLKGKETV
jgi:hypothetical protein